MEVFGTAIDSLTLTIAGIAFIVMMTFAYREWNSRRRGGHADYKAVIVSIGVLGTFVGIFIGLWQFDTADIQGSVPRLLEGLKLAFLTSILGMLVSVILAGMERKDESSFADEAAALSSIDQKLAVAPQIAENTAETVDQLKHFRMEVRDEQLKSREFLREQLLQTNEALEKAVESLAQGATAEIIEALQQVISDFNQNLTEQFGENFKELNAAVHKLVDWQENYRTSVEESTRLLQAISESLQHSDKTLSEISQRNAEAVSIHENLRDTLVEQNTQLETSGAHLQSQKELVEKLGKMMENYAAVLEKTGSRVDNLSETIRESVTAQSKALKSLTDDIEEQLPKTLAELDSNLAGLTKRFAADYQSFLDNYRSLVDGAARAN